MLYTSHAKSDLHPESNIDFAVILTSSSIRQAAEIFKTAPISANLNLKYCGSISTHLVIVSKTQTSGQSVYQEIRKEDCDMNTVWYLLPCNKPYHFNYSKNEAV